MTSTFDVDAEGWTVVGDPVSATPTHVAAGGNPGGFIQTQDSRGGLTMFWSAPPKFLGDRRASYGANLSFDLRQSSTDSQFPQEEVVLEGGGEAVIYDATHPGTAWTPYTVALTEGEWMLRGTSPLRPATREELTTILADLTALKIRAEYVFGPDTDDLDNVVLEESPPADTDGDGIPDSADACPSVPAPTPDGCPLIVRQPMPQRPPAAPGPPILGKTVNVAPVSGEVFVSVPARRAGASAVVPGLKGRSFVRLSQARQIPVGSFLDTRNGTVRLTSARDAAGTVQAGEFSKGVFRISQSRRARVKGLTDLTLKGSSFAACRSKGRRASTARAGRTVRRLRAKARGRFRTRGRYASATVRGTTWILTDRCDGTLTRVTSGKVVVRDLRRRKTVTLRAGKRYLAKAPR